MRYLPISGALRPQVNCVRLRRSFAQQHGIGFPFAVDPQGKLAAEVKADYALGQRVGIEHTPTIWVVTNQTTGVPYVEVVDPTKLYAIIDQAIAETASESPGSMRRTYITTTPVNKISRSPLFTNQAHRTSSGFAAISR